MKSLLVKASNWKLILFFLVFFFGCIYLFLSYAGQLNVLAGEDAPIIDLRSDYDEAEISDFFTKIQQEGREIHQYVTGVVDMVFPFAYGPLYILLLALFLKKITSPTSNWLYLSLIPVLLMITDYIENLNTLEMLNIYPDLTSEMVASASQVTGIKAMLGDVCMYMILLLAVVWLVKWFMGRKG